MLLCELFAILHIRRLVNIQITLHDDAVIHLYHYNNKK